MIRQAIILAGGLGTRLRSVVADLPKCMASVAGKPFLYYVIDHLKQEGITDFIFSIGYKSEFIVDFVEDLFKKTPERSFQFSIEEEPLGTGGAIMLACKKSFDENILVCNGDTLFKLHVSALADFHIKNSADCTLSLKPMKDFERYGSVECTQDQKILSFREKQFTPSGYINAGVYALNVPQFRKELLPEKCSFEKDYLEKMVSARKIYGFVQDSYFIDIGIPEDYQRAQREFKELL